MEGAKGVDKTSMSLDDIIKMNKKNNIRKPRLTRTNNVAKNSLNRAKKTIINKKPISSTFNRNRLGLVTKRNIIKSNIIVNKRVDLDTRINKGFSRNKQFNVAPRSFKRGNIQLKAIPQIQITTNNDQHNTFKRNNVAPRSFNNTNSNGKRFTKQPFIENTRLTATKVNQRPFYSRNDGSRFVNPINNYQSSRSRGVPTVRPAKTFNNRGAINNRGSLRYSAPRRDYSDRPMSSVSYRNSDRSQDMEYEAMARALIVAHRDSRITTSNEGRYGKSYGSSYRR